MQSIASMPKLRPYQSDCIETIIAKMRSGKQRQMIAMPTGSGKTVVLAALIARLTHGRALVLAHREELIQQAHDKIIAVADLLDQKIDVSIERAKERGSFSSKVVVSSVQTLKGKRLERWPKDHFNLVIVDECHHSTSKTYRAIIEYFGLGTIPTKGRLLLGVTATPFRGAGKQNLNEVFEEITFQSSLQDLVKDGYLCNIRGFSVGTDVSLDGIKVVAGDFDQRELEAKVDVDSRNNTIVDAIHELAPNDQTVIFTVSVKHAETIANLLTESGIIAEPVWGNMKPELRKHTLERFARGEIQCLTNVAVLTEGWDCPSVSTIVMACPTRSRVKYMQCVGRGTRVHPGKEFLKVLDLDDNISRFDLCHIGTLVGRTEEKMASGLDLLEWAEQEKQKEDKEREKRVTKLRIQTSVIDLISDATTVRNCSKYAWVELPGDRYYIRLGESSLMIHKMDEHDGWVIREGGLVSFGAKEMIDCFSYAERSIDRYCEGNDNAWLLSASARWRRAPATETQLAKLDKYHIEYPPDVTKGQAGTLITRYFDKRGWLK
jgi:superfamily II DNA or RNA helicase